jgi:hypothetical protein
MAGPVVGRETMTYLAALIVGLLAGTHIATWGIQGCAHETSPLQEKRHHRRGDRAAHRPRGAPVVDVDGDLVLLFGVADVWGGATSSTSVHPARGQSSISSRCSFTFGGSFHPAGSGGCGGAMLIFLLAGAGVYLANSAKLLARA